MISSKYQHLINIFRFPPTQSGLFQQGIRLAKSHNTPNKMKTCIDGLL